MIVLTKGWDDEPEYATVPWESELRDSKRSSCTVNACFDDNVLVAGIYQLPEACIIITTNLPGVSTKMCLPAWILWWWKQPILTRADSTGRYQGTYRKIPCHADHFFFPGSLYPRWTFHSRLLPQGRSIGRDKPKAGNRAGTARLHLFPFLFEPSIEWLSSVRGVNKGEHSQRLGWMEARGCGELLLCLIGIQFSYIPWSDRGS